MYITTEHNTRLALRESLLPVAKVCGDIPAVSIWVNKQSMETDRDVKASVEAIEGLCTVLSTSEETIVSFGGQRLTRRYYLLSVPSKVWKCYWEGQFGIKLSSLVGYGAPRHFVFLGILGDGEGESKRATEKTEQLVDLATDLYSYVRANPPNPQNPGLFQFKKFGDLYQKLWDHVEPIVTASNADGALLPDFHHVAYQIYNFYFCHFPDEMLKFIWTCAQEGAVL